MSIDSQFADNRPEMSPWLQRLFPPGIVVTEMRGHGDPSALLPEEAEFIGRSALKRARDFSAGRACARLALAQFGIRDFALRVAADRQPMWPGPVVGSISHTDGLCIAAVGARAGFLSVGVDCEVVGHVTPDLFATIFTGAEAAWVASLPHAQRTAASTLIFAAKEAFYKCQFPLTGEWLDFADLQIKPVDLNEQFASLHIIPTRPIRVTDQVSRPVSARFAFLDGFVTTAVVFERPHECQ